MSDVKVTKQNFNEEVVNSDKLVLVDFYATWCGPCKMLGPVLEQIGEEKKDILKIYKIDVDEEPELAGDFNVMSIPTLIFFKNGNIVNTTMGFHSKSEIERIINTII